MFDLAIVGVGAWGKNLIDSVQGKSELVRFTAAATRSPAKAADFAAGHGIGLGDDGVDVLRPIAAPAPGQPSTPAPPRRRRPAWMS